MSTLDTPTAQPSKTTTRHDHSISDPQYTVDLTAKHRDLISKSQNHHPPLTTSANNTSSSSPSHNPYADENIPLAIDQALGAGAGAGAAQKEGKPGMRKSASQQSLGTKVVKRRENEGKEGRARGRDDEDEEGRSWKGLRWCCCM